MNTETTDLAAGHPPFPFLAVYSLFLLAHKGIVARRLEDGKIVESWQAWDDLTPVAEMGLSPAWDEIVAAAQGGGVIGDSLLGIGYWVVGRARWCGSTNELRQPNTQYPITFPYLHPA